MIQLLHHQPSGDLYAVRTDGDNSTIIAITGPLYAPEWLNGTTDDSLRPDWVTQAIDTLANDIDAEDPAGLTWANEQRWEVLSAHLREGEYL